VTSTDTGPADADATPSAAGRWLLRRPGDERCHLRTLCVPYAGGSAAVYHRWSDLLPDGVAAWPLRLPGRDTRFAEPLATDLLSIVDEAAAALAPAIDGPFAVFGHSLGAFIGYELVRRLAKNWDLHAALLMVSARDAPQLPTYRGTIHTLDDDEFIEVLDWQYGAIPPMLRQDGQMRALYLPILRADATMLETYTYTPGPPLRCPIAVYGGTDDTETTPAGLAAWRELTTGGSSVTMLDGGHFFLESERDRLLGLVGAELETTIAP
jgi:surfactin synthase thioesterase subunit